jgi:predicted ATP-grasp superfamily ATP-dependent carboligase
VGAEVHIADSSKYGMCQWSKYKNSKSIYTSHLVSEEDFISDIIRIINEKKIEFLLPSHDETTILAKYRNRIPDNVILPIDEFDKLDDANDKYIMAKYCSKIGVPIPETFEDYKINNINPNNFPDSPLVIKTRIGNSSKGVFYSKNRLDFKAKIEKVISDYKIDEENKPIVQELVEGSGWGVSCLYWHGKLIQSFTHKRLEEKVLTGGTSSLRISKSNRQLESYAHKLLNNLSWHGLAMVEFKFNEKENKGWFIEINPRLWGSIALAKASGADFVKSLYIAATLGEEEALKNVKPWKEGVVARWFVGDMIRKLQLLKSLRIREFFRELYSKTDIYDDIRKDDLAATFGQFLYYFTKFLKYRSTNPTIEGMVK